MALGIDACAHRAALDAGGQNGRRARHGRRRRVSASAHARCIERSSSAGLVLSELEPGARSDAGSFPRRNRIIAGLARLTIVIEAPFRSGALITSTDALELGRDVAAVPGPIDSPQSQGSNELIRDGAHLITSVADALSLVGLDPIARSVAGAARRRRSADLERARRTRRRRSTSCARARRFRSPQCLVAVTSLELRGIIECALTGEIRRR